MVYVYFESRTHCELVAIVRDEKTYMKVLPIFEELAADLNLIVTESIE